MSLELTLLLAFIGLLTISAMVGPNGPIGAFRNAAPSLGARVEVQMTTGRCFAVDRSGRACQDVIAWE